jgi:RNA polymerase sigma factor (sigma-70 family)
VTAVDGQHDLAGWFEAHRAGLAQLAYRMLGSRSEAEDAVQEGWLRLARTDADHVENLAAWLRTVVSRVCLDMLRARASRREELVGERVSDAVRDPGHDPEQEALAADAVGRALLVVLDVLAPAERVAFVLHDMFAVPFDEIAPIVERSPVTTKKLASRARHKVRGVPVVDAAALHRHRDVVEAFLAAARVGDVDALVAVLDSDVVRRADAVAVRGGRAAELRGVRAVAQEIAVFGRDARFAELALVDGDVGVVVAPRGRLLLALVFTIADDKVVEYELVADPARLRRLDVAVLALG